MKQLVIGKITHTICNEESFRAYMKEVNEYDVLTPDEEFAVATEARNGNKLAKEHLIKSNLKFVISVAKQYTDSKYKIEDLVNEGNIGLIIAADRFDPTRGFKFISYAVWWIRRCIMEYKTGPGEFIKKPSNRVLALNKFREIKNILELQLEREPTHDEIVAYMEIHNDGNLEIIRDLDFQDVCSLDNKINDDGFTLNDTISDYKIADEKLLSKDGKFILTALLSQLKPKQREVIERFFGLKGYRPMTLQEIGDAMSLTREAIRQIKISSLESLREISSNKSLTFSDML